MWGPGDWADAEAKGGLSGAIICKPVSKDVFVLVCLCLGVWVCPRVHWETTLGWAHQVGLWGGVIQLGRRVCVPANVSVTTWRFGCGAVWLRLGGAEGLGFLSRWDCLRVCETC